jgi:hypothetical protein
VKPTTRAVDQIDRRLDWPHDTHVPWVRHRSTRAGVAEHFTTLAAEHVPERAGLDLGQIIVDGCEAVITATIHNTVRRTGAAYSTRVALHLGVANGQIIRHHVYEDSLSVARAWGHVGHAL